jgi:hypothetical protein
MTQIELNNAPVELAPQEPQSFAQLARTLLPAMIGGRKMVEVLCGVVAEGLKRGVEPTHPTFQASLWTMHQVGVRAVRINMESGQAELRTEKTDEFDRQPFESHFTAGNIATGRALVATLVYFMNRAIRVNGAMRPVKAQTLETMQKVNQEVTQSRIAGEDMQITAVKHFMRMVEAGHADDSPEIAAAVQVLADCSIAALSYDVEKKTVSIEGFNEANACAVGYLQGLNPEQIAEAHRRVAGLNARMMAAAMPVVGQMPAPRRRRS